jgi:hypothetical protein
MYGQQVKIYCFSTNTSLKILQINIMYIDYEYHADIITIIGLEV